MIGIGTKGLTSVKGNNTDLKSQSTVTEWTVSRGLREVQNPSGPGPESDDCEKASESNRLL